MTPGLALAVSLLARFVGLDRDRAFYPTVTIVVASYYGLFAVMGGFMRALTLESVAIGGFILDSVLGFRLTLWLVVAALFAHGVFDFFHGRLLANPGVPAWWPGFCLAYDITAAGYLGWLLRSGRRTANSPGIPPDSIR
ncbi:MAG: hypothetical protein DVB31_10545 [Verrucomicrobia bacterium]|nr:MAG: hypothetical protein DVB31_10545 [Verrucomicrobiota bacterium]